MSKNDEEYQVGETCIFTEEGCNIRVRILTREVRQGKLYLELVVLERLDPNVGGRYPKDSEVGDVLAVNKEIGFNLPGWFWELKAEEDYRSNSVTKH